MENIFKTSKRCIIAILTLCVLLGIAGTCLNVTAMAEDTTVATEETAVAIEEITIVTEESRVANEKTTATTEETTPELIPMMAQRGCGGYSYYDGMTFNSTAQGLNTMGIPFSGSGLGIALLSPQLNIDFGQRGTDLCVFITDSTTGSQLSWFKVKRW